MPARDSLPTRKTEGTFWSCLEAISLQKGKDESEVIAFPLPEPIPENQLWFLAFPPFRE